MFDLTTPRGDHGDNFAWRVGMVLMELYEMEEFYDIEEFEYQECYEPMVEVPDDVAIMAMDLQDDDEEMVVSMVRMQPEEMNENCLITLDSGADISVLPRDYAGVGERREGDGGLKMV